MPNAGWLRIVTFLKRNNMKYLLSLLLLTNLFCHGQNQPPVARAGNDIQYPLSWHYSPYIYGTYSTDADGWIVAYSWAKISGPEEYLLSAPTGNKTRLDNLTGGVYVFELTVTDNKGATDTDSVQVTMIDDLPKPVDTIPSDSNQVDSSGNVLRRVETLIGTIQYIDMTGKFVPIGGKLVREIWYNPENNVEYPITRSITTDSGKVIDRNKYYKFYDSTQRQ